MQAHTRMFGGCAGVWQPKGDGWMYKYSQMIMRLIKQQQGTAEVRCCGSQGRRYLNICGRWPARTVHACCSAHRPGAVKVCLQTHVTCADTRLTQVANCICWALALEVGLVFPIGWDAGAAVLAWIRLLVAVCDTLGAILAEWGVGRTGTRLGL